SATSKGATLVWPAATSLFKIDFNGDGKEDILWQNISSGDCTISLMNGTTVSSTVSLGKFATADRIAGTGDFNGDGKADILWQNTKTRECTVWLMTGTTVKSKLAVGKEAAGWQACRAGDFNRDGNADILW